MPADPLVELPSLAAAGGIVAAGAVPVAVLAAGVARRLRTPLLPRWRHTTAGWEWPDLVALFVLYFALIGSAVLALERVGFFRWVYGPGFDLVKDEPPGTVSKAGVWGSVFAAPLLLAAGWLIRSARGLPTRFDPRAVPARFALAVAAWVAVTPVVFGVNLAANWLVSQAGGEPEKHPLTQIGADSALIDRVLLGLTACVAAPLAEEFLFRGLLVRWAAERRYRPWILAAVSLPAAGVRGGWQPAAFALVLFAGLWLSRRRTAAAIYSTAVLFAVAHGGVWPSPVPLFVLGLALGYLAARTGGITACVVLHGLFNAVSFVYLLRGGPG